MNDALSGKVPRRRLGIWLRRRGGVIQAGYRDVALELSDSARFLFELADGARHVGDLAAALALEYGIPAEDALEDTTAFIAEMVELQLMVLDAEDAASPR